MIGTLNRYLLRQNFFLVLICLSFGAGIYLLSDIFDRLDDFLEAGTGLPTMLMYFVAKLPLMISQILPAVFLVALIIQLSLMQRSRELLALSAGGISPASLARLFLCVGLAWGLIQISFSQAIGVKGEQKASMIWGEGVRKKQASVRLLKDIWFREGSNIVYFVQADPRTKTGENITIYGMDGEKQAISWIIKAKTFKEDDAGWHLYDATTLDTVNFSSREEPEVALGITQHLRNFVAVDPHTNPASLPLWQLGSIISVLKASGSNVERLLTAWHMKLAYGFAIPVMSLLALAVVSLEFNVYYNVGISLVTTFAFYALFLLFTSAGQKGLLSPLTGAWLADAIFGGVAALRLFAVTSPETFRRVAVDPPMRLLRRLRGWQ